MTSTDTGGPRGRRVPRAGRSARRARRRRRGSSPACGSAPPRSAGARAAARARADAVGRAAARQRRHAPAQARERGLDAIVLAACGLDRLGLAAEIGARPRPEAMLPEAAQGALALQVRAGEEELVARADHAETRGASRPSALCVATIGAGCLAPVAAHHDGDDAARADRRRGRRLGRAAQRRRSGGARATSCWLAARAMKVIVTRPRAQAQPLVERARGARPRGRRVPADRDRAHLRRADRLRGLRLADRHEPERRRRDRAPRPQPARRSPRSGPARPRRCARTGSSPRSSPRVSSQDGLLREFPRPAGQRALRRGRGRAPRADRRARRRLRRRSTARGCCTPEPPEGDVVVLASGSAARAYAAIGGAAPGGLDRARDDARRARGRARGRRRGGDARPRRARRGASRDVMDSQPSMTRRSRSSPTSGCRTTSSACATA